MKLRRIERGGRRAGLPPRIVDRARELVERVLAGDDALLLAERERLDGIARDAPLTLGAEAFERAFASLTGSERGRLQRIGARIERFAAAQREALLDVELAVGCGATGHDLVPVEVAGCYVPAGRYPLPSSMLMSAIPARVAGVERIFAASPTTDRFVLAAAHVARVEALLFVGGALAIAALARGAGGLEPCDTIVGPGGIWTTAAKFALSDRVGIDGLAGPSEVLVVADHTTDPARAAAELVAQAEHDERAEPILLALDGCAAAIERAIVSEDPVVERALANGGLIECGSPAEAIALANRVASEHVVWLAAPRERLRRELRHCGTLVAGAAASVALGDYGLGPNHTLPTGGGARYAQGLSVATFLKARSWIEARRVDTELLDDALWLARVEGLEGHARALERSACRGERERV